MGRVVWAFIVRVVAGFEVAVGGIATGGLRSVLTVLGVAIGVASVVSLLAVGQGARSAVAAQYQSLGTNVITVQSHSTQVRLTATTASGLQQQIPFVTAAMPVVGISAPVRWRGTASVSGGDTTILGVTPELLSIRKEKVLEGAFLSPLEESNTLNVAVLGYTAAQTIFGGLDPVGQEIFVGQAPFRVIGVLAYQGGAKIGSGQVAALTPGTGGSGSSGTGSGSAGTGSGGSGSGSGSGSGCGSGSGSGSGSSGGLTTGVGGGSSGSTGSSTSCSQQTVAVGSGIDNAVLIPESTAVWLTNSTQVSAIWMKARNRTDVEPAVLEAQRILQDEFGLQSGNTATGGGGPIAVPGGGFIGPGACFGCQAPNPAGTQLVLPGAGSQAVTVSSLNSLVKQADAANRVLTLMLAAIAGVSLLVGGIGVMNIMLVSVRERTVEIGLRKALGAFQVDLLYQFVLEALLVSVLGGFCGWLAGFLGVRALQHLHVDAVPLPGALLIALAAAAGVGVLFGTYPAYLASELQPVEALRRQ
jgi:hypothetical protein